MQITNARWIDPGQTLVADIDGETVTVSADPANRHFAQMLQEEAAGTLTIAPSDTSATTRQNILSAPSAGFGGPTMKDTLNGY